MSWWGSWMAKKAAKAKAKAAPKAKGTEPQQINACLEYSLGVRSDDHAIWAYLKLECDNCGGLVWIMPAHHMRAIAQALLEMAENPMVKAETETIADLHPLMRTQTDGKKH